MSGAGLSSLPRFWSLTGKAGGFLASDWLHGSPAGALARRSYELHLQLAQSLPAEASCGFRPVETVSLELAEPSGTSTGPMSHTVIMRVFDHIVSMLVP